MEETLLDPDDLQVVVVATEGEGVAGDASGVLVAAAAAPVLE